MLKLIKDFWSIKAISLALFAIAASLAARGLSTGYSYWFDELYSVSYSVGSWQDLYRHGIIDDVHPPLYQIILKLWISLTGSSNEVTTRLLSFSFALLTLLAFCSDAIKHNRWRRVGALALVGASPLFTSYAQETRSYSLALLLATVVTLSILQLRETYKAIGKGINLGHKSLEAVYYIGCILLSLVHYFGLIFVVIISLMNFIENRLPAARIKSILLVISVMIWPIWHILAGGIVGRTGGNFWIKVSQPILGTINLYLQGNLYFLSLGGPPSRTLISYASIAFILLILSISWQKLYIFVFTKQFMSATADESRYLLYIIFGTVALISAIDIHTPISTPRNYIELLPATMILLANSISLVSKSNDERQWFTIITILFSALIVILLFIKSQRELSAKVFPSENWKQLASYVRESKICSDECLAVGSKGLHSYYFRGINNIVYIADITDKRLIKPSVNEVSSQVGTNRMHKILGFKDATTKINEYLERGQAKLVCLQPSQGSANQTFIILPKASLTGLEEKHGLVSCE